MTGWEEKKTEGQWEGKGALAGSLRKAPDQPGVRIHGDEVNIQTILLL